MTFVSQLLADRFNANERRLKQVIDERVLTLAELNREDNEINRLRAEQQEIGLAQNALRQVPPFVPAGTTVMDDKGTVIWKQDETDG